MADECDLFSAFDEKETLTATEVADIGSNSTSSIKEEKEESDLSSRKRKKKNDRKEQEDEEASGSESEGEFRRKMQKTLAQKPRIETGKIIDASPAGEKYVATGTQQKNLISFSAFPPDYQEPPVKVDPNAKPAKEYPFTLDPFQQQAVDFIEKGESVLVSAHTSAGKTAVAEYAIAKSLRDKQRVIYTSPIKALSNQKYRDLQEEFEDVGLMTGDITINPQATCLIMTTEILRSMLYRGSEVMREVAWVIYDEIHYMRDKERGVVWEESIILLPHKVRFVFLSATIPNSKEFAAWICHIHHQPCHVVYTDYRPTPLEHFVFPAGGDGLHLVVDQKGKFREDNFQKAMGVLCSQNEEEEANDQYGSKNRKKKKQSGKKKIGSDVFRIVKLMMERHYDPVIIFSFSKRECEAYALLLSKLDFNTDEEKEMVHQVFHNAIDSLSDDDKTLPQVDSILPLLKRGIGIHHGGLLPILKEVIEIMFGEGLLKCLFATETFSMGLNMPAKTVVFTSCRKYDGKDFRWITSGEYIQMSGRAGRRSLDSRGIVVQMLNEQMEPEVAKGILYGQADPLYSTFHLGYNMLLNLLRVEDANPEYMIKQSFHQFQNEQTAPELEEALKLLEEESRAIKIKDENEVAEYYYITKKMARSKQSMREILNSPVIISPYLNAGRLVRVTENISGENVEWGWGVVVNFQKSQSIKDSNASNKTSVHVLLNCVPTKNNSDDSVPPQPASSNSLGTSSGEMKICPVSLNVLDGISSLRVYIPKDLRSVESRQAVGKSVKEVLRRFPKGVPLLDPIKDMQLGEDSPYHQHAATLLSDEEKLFSLPFHKAKDMKSRFELYSTKMENEAKVREIKRQIKDTRSLVLRDDLRHRKRVLRRLGFASSDNVIDTKGRTACEISTADELLCTEMIFNGVFNELSVNETVALLSCLINTEKKKEGQPAPAYAKLEGPIRQLRDMARHVAKTMQEAKISIDVDEFADKFSTSLVDVVMSWCEGAKFSQICKMTDAFEGSIIRIIRRLEELLRQLGVAAHAIGNKELEQKFADGVLKIKRDIVFAASLYL